MKCNRKLIEKKCFLGYDLFIKHKEVIHMDYKAILLNVKEQYDNLEKGKKAGITILILCFLCMVAYKVGCSCGEAIYYIIY